MAGRTSAAQLTKRPSSGEYRRPTQAEIELKKKNSLERAREVLRLAEARRLAAEEELAAAKELVEAEEREAETRQFAQASFKGRETDLTVGQRVAALVGRKKFADCEVVNIGILLPSNEYVFEVKRLDEGKSIRFKPADELFPVEFLND